MYPRAGEWTAAALAEDKLTDRIRTIRKDRNAAEAKADRLDAKVTMLNARITELESANPPDCATQIKNAHDGGRESAFVQMLQCIQAQRSEPE